MKQLFLALLFGIATALFPLQAFAAAYNSCAFGSGVYNVGCSPASPTTTPIPTSSSGSSNESTSSSGGGSASASPTTCTAQKPSSTPDLFQINANAASVTVYFSPSSGERDRYFIAYGTSAGSEQYGTEFMDSSTGVIAATIGNLQPKTIYYFKVRAGNGCQPGEWSNSLAVKTGQRLPTFKWTSLPRIVTTAIIRQVKPSSVQQVTPDTSTSLSTPTPTESAAPEYRAPIAQPTTEPTPTVPAKSASLFQRISQFFVGLLGK